MPLMELFDEIAEKCAGKTELGERRIFGAIVGIVAANYSEDMPGRLCVAVPVRDENANQLKWAKVAMPYIGSGWGSYFLPEKDDQVILVFEDGNIEKPYVIGCIPRDTDSYLKKTATEKNNIKQIQTRNGSRITFEDGKEDGSEDKITLTTAGEGHTVSLDNEKKKITLADSEKNCLVELATESGKLTIHAEQKLELTVGDTIKVVMNGSGGSIKMEAEKVQISAGKSVSLESDGKVVLNGSKITIEAGTSLSSTSSGMYKIEGKPVSIG